MSYDYQTYREYKYSHEYVQHKNIIVNILEKGKIVKKETN